MKVAQAERAAHRFQSVMVTGSVPQNVQRAGRPPAARRALAIAAVVLQVILGLGALGGGLALMLGPHGEILPLPISLLNGSPFTSYLLPGMILFTVLGVGPLVVAGLAWRRQRWAPLLTVGVGVALLNWLAVEIALIGYSNDPPLQPIYIVLGVAIVLVGMVWLRQAGWPFPRHPAELTFPEHPAKAVISAPLIAVKVAHTVVWALFAGCILTIPLVSWRGAHHAAALLTAIVLIEVIILMLNHWRCPLTSVAARYTSERRANFDIYLPEWLAKSNKLIFGLLYFAGALFALARWACAQ